jgi:hypothetical protein
MSAATPTLNVRSDGMGSWAFGFLDPVLKRTFPHTQIVHDDSRAPDLVIRSHFTRMESLRGYSCPYITWSGEVPPVAQLPDRSPLFELNTARSGRPNEVWFPHLVAEIAHTDRPSPIQMPKRWCCAYAFTARIPEREHFFRLIRAREPTCYAFGPSCKTSDNPFEVGRGQRGENGNHFRDFAYCVAMENCVAPGYMTEKIGFAFLAGSVPIYRGDDATVKEFFNPASFINVPDFASPEAAAETCVEIWHDPQKLQKYLDAPLTLNDRLRDYEAIWTDYRPWQKPMVDSLQDAFPDLS